MVLGIGASELAMQLSPRADALHIGQSQPTIKPPDQIWTIHQTMGVVVVIVVVVIVVVVSEPHATVVVLGLALLVVVFANCCCVSLVGPWSWSWSWPPGALVSYPGVYHTGT